MPQQAVCSGRHRHPVDRTGRHRRAVPSPRRRWTAAAVVAVLGASLLGAPLGAATAEGSLLQVAASEDGYVSEADPRAVFNTERLSAGSGAGDSKISYLTFSLRALPLGARDIVASIVLTRDLHHLPGSVELSTVPDTRWSERSLTMANAPAIGARLAEVHPTTTTSQITFPIPAGTITVAGAYSFAVTSAVTDDVARFRSSEYGAEGPRLMLSFRTGGTTPPPPPPGDLSDVWVGAAASEPAAGGGIDYGVGVFNDSNADIGPLVYRRSFDTTIPTSFQTSMARDDAANGYRSFVSWKPPNHDFVGAAEGRYDAAVTAWAKSVPQTGVYATSFHEPENDMTGPQFVAMQRHLYAVVKAANPSIQWGPVYMAYWWDDGTSHFVGDMDAWWPGNDYADFTAVDVYSNDAQPLETHSEFRGWYDYMLGKGEEMIIAEYGQYVVKPGLVADPAKLAHRVDVIAQDAQWLAEQGTISMWLYWDAMGQKGDWRLQDGASQQAWRNVSEAGRTP